MTSREEGLGHIRISSAFVSFTFFSFRKTSFFMSLFLHKPETSLDSDRSALPTGKGLLVCFDHRRDPLSFWIRRCRGGRRRTSDRALEASEDEIQFFNQNLFILK